MSSRSASASLGTSNSSDVGSVRQEGMISSDISRKSMLGKTGEIVWHSWTYLTTIYRQQRRDSRDHLALTYSPNFPWSLQVTFGLALAGFASGAYITGRHRGLQFLAENCHRLPKTKQGWYNYHRFKHFEQVHSGAFGGLRYGLQFAAVGAAFCAAEYALEKSGVVGEEGWAVGMGAGVAASTVFSVTSRLNLQYGKYALLFGAGVGLGIGLIEDAYAWATGESVKHPSRKRTKFFLPGLSQI